MLKKSNLDLILSMVSIGLAVFAFISLAFNFTATEIKFGDYRQTDNASLADWNDQLDNPIDGVKMGAWPVSRVFMWFGLVLVLAMAVLVLVRFFYDNQIMRIVTLSVAGVTVLCLLIFFITFLVGMDTASQDYADYVKIMGGKYSYSAGVAVWFITLAGLGTAVCGGITVRETVIQFAQKMIKTIKTNKNVANEKSVATDKSDKTNPAEKTEKTEKVEKAAEPVQSAPTTQPAPRKQTASSKQK